MSQATPLLPIQGVPTALIEALNLRFREVTGEDTASSSAGKPGIFFTAKSRPDANGTAVGTFGAETDTGVVYQVQTVGSQQTWVPVAGSGAAQIAYASLDLTLVNGTYNDVTGATLTLARAGRYLISASFYFVGVVGAGTDDAQVGVGRLMADGVAQTGLAVFQPLVSVVTVGGTGVSPNPTTITHIGRGSVFQQWLYTAAASGKVVKLQAEKLGGTGSSVASTETSISALWVGP